MSRDPIHPESLFDRPWRPGHPFRPRVGRFRRVLMVSLLILLSAIIWAYSYLTDSRRVRSMAEVYLSELAGGRVTIQGASLTLFEGLRLDGVKIFVDRDAEPQGKSRPDSLLFSARTVLLQYDPTSLINGKLEAQQIMVERPEVHLCRDEQSDNWNFQRLRGSDRPRPAPRVSAPSRPPPLPDLLLRNAMVEIAELRGDRTQTLGYMALDGQLTSESLAPAGDDRQESSTSETNSDRPLRGTDRYHFVLQSRGVSDEVGPLATGTIHLPSGRVVAQLKEIRFGGDFRAMLFPDVRGWCERHELSGRIDVTTLDFTPARAGSPPKFFIETQLNGVSLSISPREWMSVAERMRRDDAKSAAEMSRRAYAVAGYLDRAPKATAPVPDSTPTPPLSRPPGAIAPPAFVGGLRPALNPAIALGDTLESSPVQLGQVSGAFVFTEKGVEIRKLTGRVENNLLTIDGRIDGYQPESPLSVRIASSASENLHIPAAPRYVWSLPRGVREFYDKLRPQGNCKLQLDMARRQEGGGIDANGFVELLDASFLFDEFPYPVRHTHGRIELTRDEVGQDWILLKGVRGLGVPDGPNREHQIGLDGWVGPVNVPGQEPGGLIKIRASDISSEPALAAAFDDDVREALRLFDAPGQGVYPIYRGDVGVDVFKGIGEPGKFKVRVDLAMTDAQAVMDGFPYPLSHLSGQVHIRDGYATIENVRASHGGGTIAVQGMAAWKLPTPKRPLPPADALMRARRQTDLQVTVRGVPIDRDLLAALPTDSAQWVEKTGVQGKIDIDGRLTGKPGGRPWNTDESGQTFDGPTLRYDLDVHLNEGSLRPNHSDYVVSQVAGRMRLTPEKLDLLELKGVRGQATLSGVGQVLMGAEPTVMLLGSAQNVALEPALYALLPADAKDAWDEVRPNGTVDAEMTFSRGGSDVQGHKSGSVAVINLDAVNSPATQPAAAVGDDARVLRLPAAPGRPAIDRPIPPGLAGTLRPRKLSASLKTVPYALQDVRGEVAITPSAVELHDLSGRHGSSVLKVDGVGTFWPAPVWKLAVHASDLPADKELRDALPPSLSSMLDEVKLAGTLSIDLDTFTYRSAPTGPSAPGATQPVSGPELDLAGNVRLRGASFDAGISLKQVEGSIGLSAAVRGSRLQSLQGRLNIDSLDMAGRKVTQFQADMTKPPDAAELTLTKMRAVVGDGDLAGQVSLSYPDTGPARYGLSLFLRNADVRELAKEASENLSGRVTASLALEGDWGKSGKRRGRGDVLVSGKEMYRIPLVLGLMQVTNLSLPVNSPFSSGVARYSVDGQKVIFERIELRNNNMLMSGNGSLDFETRQVQMTFVTDNPGAFKIPFVQDLWRGAQQELLRIHVRGTVEDPKVQNRPLGTFTTTVDEVFNGDPPRKKKK